jgi:hypothetical protein
MTVDRRTLLTVSTAACLCGAYEAYALFVSPFFSSRTEGGDGPTPHNGKVPPKNPENMTALGLAQAGVDVCLIEAGEAIISSPRACVYHWSMLDGLERLGIRERSDWGRTQALRKRFDRLCLLPLQVSNEFSFDGLVNYRTQFEYLYDVLAAAPKDVAVIVTEHPNGDPVLRRSGSCANIDMLRRTFPNIVFLDEFRQCQSPSQLLVPRVDGVWTVSSSVGYQALLFSRLLGSPSSTELSHVADATTLEDFFARLGHRRSTNVDADNFLAWLLERYLVPASLLTDGRWFHDYLQRRLDAARRASDPIDAFVPTADADRLMDAWIVKTPPLAMGSSQGEDDPSVAELITNLKAVRCERDALLKSTSWRVTAPLRLVKQAAGRARFRH